jgi:coatomer protein complex subunit epsilon
MADTDELFAIRNLFALGSYQSVINDISSARVTLSESAALEAKVFLYRAYIAQGKYNLVISEINSSHPVELQAVKLLAVYMQANAKGDATAKSGTVTQIMELLSEGTNAINATIQIVGATILYNESLLEDALKVLYSHGRNLEIVALIVQIYLHIDRLDLARKEIAATKSWAEDATLAQLIEAWVDLRLGGEKYQEAYYIFEEFASSGTATTLKVLNGQAVSNIAMGRYPEAESILLEALNKDSNHPDTLVNLVVVSRLTSKPTDVINRYISQLREAAPQHSFLQELDLKTSLFDRAAARYAVA